MLQWRISKLTTPICHSERRTRSKAKSRNANLVESAKPIDPSSLRSVGMTIGDGQRVRQVFRITDGNIILHLNM